MSGFGIPCRGPIVWLAILTMLQVFDSNSLSVTPLLLFLQVMPALFRAQLAWALVFSYLGSVTHRCVIRSYPNNSIQDFITSLCKLPSVTLFQFIHVILNHLQAVAMQLSIGSFYPNLLLSGILWPLEGMPPALQYIAKFLPNTLACQVNALILFKALMEIVQAMRDIMLRGWGIERPEVLNLFRWSVTFK